MEKKSKNYNKTYHKIATIVGGSGGKIILCNNFSSQSSSKHPV